MFLHKSIHCSAKASIAFEKLVVKKNKTIIVFFIHPVSQRIIEAHVYA